MRQSILLFTGKPFNLRLVASETDVLPWWGERWHKPLFAALVVAWIPALISAFISTPIDWTPLFLIAALLSSLATLGRQLPFQNILLIAFMIAGASTIVTLLLAGRWNYVNWRLVVLWTTLMINAWGSAQLIMRRWRNARRYGWGVLLLAATIASIVGGILYNGIVAAGLAALMTFVILLISLPLFINKRPVEPPVSWQPIVVLLLFLAWALLPRI